MMVIYLLTPKNEPKDGLGAEARAVINNGMFSDCSVRT